MPLVSVISLIFRCRETRHGPLTLQLRAVQIKPQKTFVVVSLNQLVGAEIPNHHRAAAILSLRDDAFEVEIIDRMIFSRHREPSLIFLERWTFGNGP